MNTVYKILIIGLLLFLVRVNAQSALWSHDQGFKDELLYLHVMENYAYNPSWVYEWEKSKYKSNSAFLNFGSVEIHDLFNDIRILINEPLDSNWTFMADYKKYSTHFVNQEIQQLYLGLERRLYSNFKVFMQFNPAFNKEFIDVRIGGAWYNSDQTNYIRFALQADQFVYDEKNDFKGITEQQPYGLNWNVRLGNKKWSLYSEGLQSAGFIWNYPDSCRSLGLKSHQGSTNRSVNRLYYFFSDDAFLRFETTYYEFHEKKIYTTSAYDYNVHNRIVSLQLLYSYYLSSSWRLRISGRYLAQKASSSGMETYQYDRNEIMPSFWIDYQSGRHNIELAVMESFYEWDSKSVQAENDYFKQNNIEKVKLGWSYQFKNDSRLQLSLSHVFSISGFGGFNVNYLLVF